MKNMFDEKYFEDGVRNRVSAYENFRWMPERTIREASSIINHGAPGHVVALCAQMQPHLASTEPDPEPIDRARPGSARRSAHHAARASTALGCGPRSRSTERSSRRAR